MSNKLLAACGFQNRWAIILLTLLVACADGAPPQTSPEAAYTAACRDASVAEADEIVNDLTPITDWNEELIWEDGTGSRVLVVSWVTAGVAANYLCPAEGCAPDDLCKEGRSCPGYRYDTWVTVVPELLNFFGNAPPQPLRIAQLLGLPPEDAQRKEYLLEMYVFPQDLFRPCPDPDISDSQCELDFPEDSFRVFDPTLLIYADQNSVNAFVDYPHWFDNRQDFIYSAARPYPWTRLGYTYDWGRPLNPVGLSEFVVHGNKPDGLGIEVKIHRVCRTQAYFAAAPLIEGRMGIPP